MDALIGHLLSTFTALFPIANPIGAVPIFFALTEEDTPRDRGQQARSTAVNVIWVLAAFFLLGKFLLSFFGISLGVLQIAGGLVVAHTAWEMVTTRQRLTEHEHHEASMKTDVSFTPMAMPLVAGPGAIGVVIGLSETATRPGAIAGSLLGIVGLGVLLYLLLSVGEPLIKRLGQNGLGVINRVLGFFVLAIGVQLIVNGVLDVLKPLQS